MKKILGLSLAIGVGFLLGALSLALCLTARAGTEPRTTTMNGDGNGDGEVNVSDAVYLLNWLFAGGSDLAEFDCPAAQPRSSLVATGQVECFGTTTAIDCVNERARGQDGFHQAGCPLEGRFVDNGDGTVSDTCTGLMWTKNIVDVNDDGEVFTRGYGNPSPDELTWLEACQFAADMTFAGRDDWRVPNAQELLSIMDLPQTDGRNLGNPTPFGLFPPFLIERSWSSTHLGSTSTSFGYNLITGSFACDCGILKYGSHAEANAFAAVRGP